MQAYNVQQKIKDQKCRVLTVYCGQSQGTVCSHIVKDPHLSYQALGRKNFKNDTLNLNICGQHSGGDDESYNEKDSPPPKKF